MDDSNTGLSLVCRVQMRLCALPLEHVVETLRALPIEPVAGAPPFVLGLAVIRGAPLPVVDSGRLLGLDGARAERFVIVMAGNRRVALAVDNVVGIRAVAPESLVALPPLLHAAESDVISAIGLLDAELLLVLRNTSLLPDEVVQVVQAASEGAQS
jgi:purine-binding chemotaxis protein CheW